MSVSLWVVFPFSLERAGSKQGKLTLTKPSRPSFDLIFFLPYVVVKIVKGFDPRPLPMYAYSSNLSQQYGVIQHVTTKWCVAWGMYNNSYYKRQQKYILTSIV